MVTRAPVRPVPARVLGAWAAASLREEAELSPKPGLVDRRGPGAHRDMDLPLLLRSAGALEPWFERLAAVSTGRAPDGALRTDVGEVGRQAETRMLAATGGVNTHRGALFALGLLVAGAAATGSRRPATVAGAAGALARCKDRGADPPPPSHGQLARGSAPRAGALRQAQDGFPAVVDVALPRLWADRDAGALEPVARVNALLALMSVLDDTCVLYRGGGRALRTVQDGATGVLARGGVGTTAGRSAFAAFDRRLARSRLSPGGSGDLLAATLLLDRLWEPRCRT